MVNINILYIHTHDSGRMLSPYGVNTPTDNMLNFAKDSIVFRQAHCVSPTCSPSRASLLTGLYPHNNGMYGLAHRGFKINDYKKHLASYLKNFGYETVLCGIQHEASLWDKLNLATEVIGYDKNLTLESKGIPQEELYLWDINNAKRATSYIKEAKKNNKKFFLSYGMFSTHRRYPVCKDDLVDDRYIQMPPYVVDNKENRKDTARFYTSAKYADECFGKIIKALKDNGLYNDTLIIFTTDHGVANPFNKCNLLDAGTGVALMMRNPKNKNNGRVIDSLVSHIDIFPTICDIAQIDKPHWLQGKSLIDIIEEKEEEVNEEIYSEINFHTSYEPMRAIRTKQFKYIKYYDKYNKINYSNIDDSPIKKHLMDNGLKEEKKEMEALYDLYLDPWERKNVINDEKYKYILEKLRYKLCEWQEKTDDSILKGNIEIPKKAKVNKCECISASSKNREDYVQLPKDKY